MKDQVSEQQVRLYRDQGFLAIEGFYDRDEIVRWRSAVDEAVVRRLAAVERCLAEQRARPGLGARARAALKSVLGADGVERLRRGLGPLSAAASSPRASAACWAPTRAIRQASIPRSTSSACTSRRSVRRCGEHFADLFKLYPQWRSIEPVGVPCSSGSAVFHNGYTAHGAGINMTARVRRAYAVAFMPDGACFNGIKDVLDDRTFRSLKKGQELRDEGIHPLIWHRRMEAAPVDSAAA